MMEFSVEFSWITAAIGGGLIGLSAALLLAFNGQIAGISGLVNGAMRWDRSGLWRWLFLVGLVLGAWIYEGILAAQPTPESGLSPRVMIWGGVLVGFGTRLGNGCTSGHGVCGLGRLSARSLIAVITFLVTGFLTVFVLRHGLQMV